ncbi:MAG: cation:proton antiporter, partial [Candidatus Dadabacteria bacterium]|nr:cation:proton antiporter [Candidatus Dadabacteria bacterium]
MGNLSADNITAMFLALGILLGTARLLGELAQRLHQPSVLGELLAGVLLGPTVLGTIAPDIFAFIFP